MVKSPNTTYRDSPVLLPIHSQCYACNPRGETGCKGMERVSEIPKHLSSLHASDAP